MDKTTEDGIGSPRDFEAFFTKHYPLLYSYAMRSGADRQLVEDALQEVFSDVWKNWEKWPGIENQSAYLRTMCRRELGRQRKATRLREARSIASTEVQNIPPYEVLLLASEREQAQKQRLKKALDSLSAAEKQVLELRFYQELSYEEIAQRTGKTKRTVYNQVFSAIVKLKKQLKTRFLSLVLFFS